jgi:Tfp pilus assembly protein PilV
MYKLINRQKRQMRAMSLIKRQAGASLMETMIALGLSALVTSAMVVLMANSLGTATRIIHMTQLTDELRNAMSMMTRDVRRANYSANAIFCYGNSNCGASGAVAQQAGDIQVLPDDECFSFTLDRNSDGNAANDSVSAFRRVTPNEVGVIEMWAGAAGTTPNCGAAPGDFPWIAVTDPRTVNVTLFTVDDAASFIREITESETSSFNNRQRQVQITLEGQLVLEEARGDVIVGREVGDIIYVRNDYIVL